MSKKPSLPQGTRDFGPDVVRKRTYILNTIRNVFELYGFQPLETPAMENLDTLMGKYGEEGDKLIFRILESGDSFKAGFFDALGKLLKEKYDLIEYHKNNVPGFENAINPFANPLWEFNPEVLEQYSDILRGEEIIKKQNEIKSKNLAPLKLEVGEKALKYDLTIPFARYVAMNHNKLTFPFKRYQIQPVWRADRPQRGRYREFYQCDADVVGSNALLNEIELANIYATVFEKLKIPVEIKINSRKILVALAEICGGADKLTDITVAIDKLDKIGLDKVKEELSNRGLVDEQVNAIEKYLTISGSNDEKIAGLKNIFGDNATGIKGIEEMSYIISQLKNQNTELILDPTLARGLNYYTGSIFEIKALNVNMGSIGGGGRYDDLTGLFGVPNIPGVGISFGVDRIYDVMEELNLFPPDVHIGTQVMFFNLGEAESKAAFKLMQQLRQKGIRSELFHEQSKFDKQFKYAEKKNIPYIIIIGDMELKENTCTVKNLANSQQETISTNNLLSYNF